MTLSWDDNKKYFKTYILPVHKNIPGFCNYHDVYCNLLQNFKPGAKIAEIGAFKGKGTCSFLSQLRAFEDLNNITFYAVDTFEGSEEHESELEEDGTPLIKQFTNNVTPYALASKNFTRNNRVGIIQGYSHEIAEVFPEKLDAVFIDAAHDYDNVMRDLRSWHPHLKEGGYFLGHDYDWDEVKRAVENFCEENKYEVIPISISSWQILADKYAPRLMKVQPLFKLKNFPEHVIKEIEVALSSLSNT